MTDGFLDNLPDLNILRRRKREKSPGPGASGPDDQMVRYIRLRCPKCGSVQVPVQHTNPEVDSKIIRHHKCLGCGRTFKSVEENFQP